MGFKVGQRVACAGGNYAVHAEYNVVPRNLITPLPDSVDFESAAFTTLGAIALHGFRLTETQVGERVAVIGTRVAGLAHCADRIRSRVPCFRNRYQSRADQSGGSIWDFSMFSRVRHRAGDGFHVPTRI